MKKDDLIIEIIQHLIWAIEDITPNGVSSELTKLKTLLIALDNLVNSDDQGGD